jgi:hypothetical protein
MRASKVYGTGWNQKAFVNKMENASRETRGKIGTEIERAVFYDATSEVDAGIFFSGGEFDVGISFVVPKHDVELRVVLLDEIVFKGEGFAFVFYDDGFKVSDFVGKGAGFCVRPSGFEKIRADAIAESARFANINDMTARVLEKINARLFRKLRGLFFWIHGDLTSV